MNPSIQALIGDWFYYFSICSGVAAILQVLLAEEWTTKSTKFFIIEIGFCVCFSIIGKIFHRADSKIPMATFQEIIEKWFKKWFPDKKPIA